MQSPKHKIKSLLLHDSQAASWYKTYRIRLGSRSLIRRSLFSRHFVNNVVISRDCGLAVVQYWGYFRVYRVRGGMCFESPPDFLGGREGAQCIAISPDSRYVALHCAGETVIWNIGSGQRSRIPGVLPSHGMAISNGNSMLATFTSNATATNPTSPFGASNERKS